MSDGDDGGPGTDAEERGTGLGPKARDLEGELAERRRERFGATAADVPKAESETPEADEEFLEPPESDAVEVDSETARSFWAAVVYVNVSLFVVVLGLLLAGFRGRTLLGGALIGAGVLAFYRAWTVYQAFRGSEDEDSGPFQEREDGQDSDGDDGTAAEDG